MPKKDANIKALNKQVQALSSKLSAMRLAAPSPKRRKRRPRNRGTARDSGEGSITVSRHELLTTVTIPVTKEDAAGTVEIEPSAFSFLANLSKSFERYRFHKAKFYWKPAVGTVYGGMFAMGVDYDGSSGGNQTRKDIVAYTPNQTGALWSDTQRTPMVIPTARLMSRKWLLTSATGFDAKVGNLKWAVSGETAATAAKTVGEIWVEYTIEFQGTQPV